MTFGFRGTVDPGFVSSGTSFGAIAGKTVGDYLLGKALSTGGAFTALAGWHTISLKQDINTAVFEYVAERIANGSGADDFAPVFAGGGSIAGTLHAWSGDSIAFDGAVAASINDQTSWQAGAVTPGAASALNILWVAGDTSGGGKTPSVPSGFTDRGGGVYDKVLTGQSGVPQNQAITFSGNAYGPMVNDVIKETGGGGPAPRRKIVASLMR